MSSRIGKKIGDTAVKSICDGLKRRTMSWEEKLQMSDRVNVDIIRDFLLYKSCKDYAMTEFGMRLDDFDSVKQTAFIHLITDDEAKSIASDTIRYYSTGIAVEKIADAALKASKILNWSGEKKRPWGNIGDLGFKPSNRTRKSNSDDPSIKYDLCARDNYVVQASGIPHSDFGLLDYYTTHVFKIGCLEARTMASQVIVIQKIIDAALEASQNLSLCSRQDEHTEGMDNTSTPDEISSELTPIVDDTRRLPWKERFMESRDMMSIFMDSDDTRERYTRIRSRWVTSSSSIKDWTRITRFIEFKARKEYAMEAYGVRLGDFQSLKKAALMLFEITEAEAENLASETLASDSDSIAFENIADVAFKASKILTLRAGKKKNQGKPGKKKIQSKTWHGDIADAGGFKSPQSLRNYCKNMDMEACKAYTMDAFGVGSVDIDFLKHSAMSMFGTISGEVLSEGVIMACQSVAIGKIVDALSKNLNLTFQVDAEKRRKKNWALVYQPGSIGTIFCHQDRLRN